MISKGMVAVLGVWLLSIGSASALVAVLNAPPVPRTANAVAALSPVVAVEPAPPVLEVPTLTLAMPPAKAVQRAPAQAKLEVKAEVSRDISAMTCGEARELTMGSGHVQICD